MAYRILFVDDEPEFVQPQIAALEEAGYRVTLETNPDGVTALLKSRSFDLIVLDLIMPSQQDGALQADLSADLAGVRLHREIRRELGLVNVPIIFLSVVRDHEVQGVLRQGEKSCGQPLRFLTKPILPS